MTHQRPGFGNLYLFDPNVPIHPQLNKAINLFIDKHGQIPDTLNIHPENVGGLRGKITLSGLTLVVVPDELQSNRAFTLSNKKGEKNVGR